MINVKDKVYSALCSISADLVVSDIYPNDWAHEYAIQYMEEENSVYSKTDKAEQYSKLRYTLYLWSNSSLSTLAVSVDEKLSALGLVRTACTDANDPSGRRHKVMRYEGIIDVHNEQMYWENNR